MLTCKNPDRAAATITTKNDIPRPRKNNDKGNTRNNGSNNIGSNCNADSNNSRSTSSNIAVAGDTDSCGSRNGGRSCCQRRCVENMKERFVLLWLPSSAISSTRIRF